MFKIAIQNQVSLHYPHIYLFILAPRVHNALRNGILRFCLPLITIYILKDGVKISVEPAPIVDYSYSLLLIS